MTELAPNKAAMLRALIEGLPNSALFRLEQMLSNQSAFDETLDAVWRMLDLEVRDRSVRDIVLAPVAGLLEGPRRVFPKALIAKLWRFLKSDHPAAVFEAEAMAKVWDPEALDVSSFDRLCLLGAEGLKADPRPEPFSSIDPSDAGGATAAAGAVRRPSSHARTAGSDRRSISSLTCGGSGAWARVTGEARTAARIRRTDNRGRSIGRSGQGDGAVMLRAGSDPAKRGRTPGQRRITISFLISAIAFAGFRPFGQTWVQFMMVWQR